MYAYCLLIVSVIAMVVKWLSNFLSKYRKLLANHHNFYFEFVGRNLAARRVFAYLAVDIMPFEVKLFLSLTTLRFRT